MIPSKSILMGLEKQNSMGVEVKVEKVLRLCCGETSAVRLLNI